MSGVYLLYGASLLVLATLWAYAGRSWGLNRLAYCMFFPTILAILFDIGNLLEFFKLVVGIGRDVFQTQNVQDKDYPILPACVIAATLVLLEICLCAAWDIMTGWGEVQGNAKIANSHHPTSVRHQSALVGLARAAGEEIGLRCFLLPYLMTQYQPAIALMISGITWGLFRTPIMILMCKRLRIPEAKKTVVVHFLATSLAAYPHSWIAIRSGYSFWASAFMHFTWNRVDPPVLGNIYTQEPGFVTGRQWKINGRGLAGCVIGIPVAFLVYWDLVTAPPVGLLSVTV